MIKKLIETQPIDLAGDLFEVHYYRNTSAKGAVSYSSEITFGLHDTVVLDDASLNRLKEKVSLVFPAALYSRSAFGAKKRSH